MEQTSTVRVPLSKGHHAVIDSADAPTITQHKWTYCNGYAMRAEGPRGKRRYIYMHRQLLDAPQGLEVDHINHDGLDNRRANLRLTTPSQNNANRRSLRAATSSYKGVIYQKNRKAWRAEFGGKHLGLFDDERDAALAYSAAALEEHGGYALLDFDPSEVPTLAEAFTRRRQWDGSSSTYRGVLWYAPRNAWRASINVKGRTKHLGYFEAEEAAARAFDRAALERQAEHGVKAVLNFPTD